MHTEEERAAITAAVVEGTARDKDMYGIIAKPILAFALKKVIPCNMHCIMAILHKLVCTLHHTLSLLERLIIRG
jgi:hypothetical protein